MKTLIELIMTIVMEFFWSLGCVAVAWNVILVSLFESLPKFGFTKLCLLTIAVDLILTPATIGGARTRGKILDEVRGKKNEI